MHILPREILNDAPTERVEAVLRSQLSYSDIARQCGLHPTFVQQVFGGKKFPGITTANRIAGYLGVTIDELYSAVLNRTGKRPAWIDRREMHRRGLMP